MNIILKFKKTIFFKLIITFILVTFISSQISINYGLAQTKINSNNTQNLNSNINDLYNKLDAAYKRYVTLLENGLENSPEGNKAFEEYVKLKIEYDKLVANSEQDSKLDPIKNVIKFSEELTNKSGDLVQTATNKIKEDILPSGKKMSLLEKVAWNLAKSIIPTAVVLTFASISALPLTGLIFGAFIIGAVTSGSITYLFEKRMNTFRDKKKTSMEILRDVTVAATTDGILAPFNMATSGLVSTFGNASIKVIIQNAIKSASLQFLGQGLASGAGGLVKKAWADYYFKYDEKIKNLQKEAEMIFNKYNTPNAPPISNEDKKRLQQIAKEIDELKANDYSLTDFRKDLERAALSSFINGALGSSLTQILANSNALKLASLKLYGNTKQANAIANWLASNPTAFLSGSTKATLEKHYLNEKINEITKLRDKYNKNSVAYYYYDNEIKRLKAQYDLIDPIDKGLESLVTNFAIQSVSLGVSLGKEKLLNDPQREKIYVLERYKAQSKEWQQVNEMRKQIEEFKLNNKPNPENYTNISKYLQDKINFNQKLAQLEEKATKLEINAINAQKLPENVKIIENIRAQYRLEQQLERNLEYARLMGDEQYLKAFKEKLKETNTNYKLLDDEQLTQIAKTEILKQNQIAYEKSKREFEEINSKLELASKSLSNKRNHLDDYKLSSDELKALEIQAATISPSVYKAKLVNLKINEMRANGAKDYEIIKASEKIYAEAEKQMLEKFGGNFLSVMYAEFVAKQLSQLKYNNEGKLELKQQFQKLLGEVPKQAESQIYSHYKKEVNNAITEQLMPNQNIIQNDDLASLFINTSLSTLFKKLVIEEGTSKLMDTTYSNFKNMINKPIHDIYENSLTPEEINIILNNQKSRIKD